MSLVTVSQKRARVYPRKFDHDECRTLREAGWPYDLLADHFGVSRTAVLRVCDDRHRERLANSSRRWLKGGTCIDCGATGITRHHKDSQYRCRSCSYAHLSEQALLARLDPDGNILCRKCGTHKPVEAFGWDHQTDVPRSTCRSCDTDRRRLYRVIHREEDRAWQREYKRRVRAQRNGHAQPSTGSTDPQ